ncbi:MAG: AAA family ATPase, partial [Lachnospiraceae bacterium]|nr:AAA family ATPase [Lachnospiraceae bacterium]
MRRAESIYKDIFVYDEKTPDFDLLKIIFIEIFDENGIAARNLFNEELFDTFKNKYNYITFMKTLLSDMKASDIIYDLVQYALRVRSTFIDDDLYTANLKFVANRMLTSADRQLVFEYESKKVERMAGFYSISEMDVAKTEKQLMEANTLLKQSVDVLDQVDKKTAHLTRIMKDTTDAITDISKRETDIISAKANSAKSDINAAYNSFLEEQRQEVILQKEVLLDQIFKESETKLSELRHMSRAIAATATSELSRINAETSNAIDKISTYMNNEDMEKALSMAEQNEALLSKINKLEILNDKNIAILEKNLDEEREKAEAVSAPQNSMGVTTVSYATPTVALPETNPLPIPEVNPLLDQSIPIEQRFKIVMEEKKRREEAGEHFHKMFDDVVIALMEDANPYMIGPSGCGKTYMVKQIASILNMDFIDIGYINEEYDILGFQTATGGYSTPNFYRCYKYGIIAFCDELDNGNSRATVKLNSFLSNNKDASYNFPNGENVKRHNNFRIIAAGNTAGNGADANYNTREKIEESVQQRFMPIYVDYDNYVEEKILGEYKDWYNFIVLFREGTDAWGASNDCSAAGILTTRDACKIKRYLDNKSFDAGKILDYEFIQTKDMEYLAFLVSFMKGKVTSYPEAAGIF